MDCTHLSAWHGAQGALVQEGMGLMFLLSYTDSTKAPIITEAYRTLARIRTGSHNLAGRHYWSMDARSSTSSANDHWICSVCRLHNVEGELRPFYFRVPSI